jgi:hypothetical protein
MPPPSSCTEYNAFPRPDITEVYGDDWIIQPVVPGTCMTGQAMTNGSLACNPDQYLAAQLKCASIHDAASGLGPFASCQLMGNATIESAYSNCAFDYCLIPTDKQLCMVRRVIILFNQYYAVSRCSRSLCISVKHCCPARRWVPMTGDHWWIARHCPAMRTMRNIMIRAVAVVRIRAHHIRAPVSTVHCRAMRVANASTDMWSIIWRIHILPHVLKLKIAVVRMLMATHISVSCF